MTEKSLTKWEQAIRNLVEATQDGKLKWKVVDPKEYLPDEDTSGAMFLVKYDNSFLILFRQGYMRTVSTTFTSSLFTTVDKEVKDYRSQLSVYNLIAKMMIYSFPYSQLIEDLYKAAAYNAANVDELINNILTKNPTKNKNTPS